MCPLSSSRPGRQNIIRLIAWIRLKRSKYHMEQQGLSAHDLMPFIGASQSGL